VAALRGLKALTQADLADQLGIDKTAVSHWELNQARPDIDRLPGIAGALGVTVTELIRGERAWERVLAVLGEAA
jgi:transcriptional regulator with XRE-family HTH domain